jgi:uncharacterized membrane protein (UPF0182 family)
MEPTLDAALARLFGGTAATPAATETTSAAPAAGTAPAPQPAGPAAAVNLTAAAAEARAHYDRAIEAQRAGDWAKYGDEIRLLGQALKQLQGGK